MKDTVNKEKDLELCDIDTHAETVSTYNGPENTTSSDPFSDELLSFSAKGFKGLIEKIPLPIKLLFMALTALLGMAFIATFLITIQSIDIRQANQSRRFVRLSILTGETVLSLQKERDDIVNFLSEYLLNNDSSHTIDIARESFKVTDAKLRKFMKQVRDSSSQSYPESSQVGTKFLQINEYREGTLNFTISGTLGFNFYSNIIGDIINLMNSMMENQEDHGIDGNEDLVNMLRMVEFQYTTKSIGSFVFSQKQYPLELYQAISYLIASRDTLLASVVRSMDDNEKEVYQQMVNGTLPAITAMESYLSSDQWNFTTTGPLPSVTKYSAILWDSVTMDHIRALRSVQSFLEKKLLKKSNDIISRGTGIIISIICVVLFFFCLVLICSSLTSCSIIGPWRRLNKMQENAISKFVPQQFLRLMNVKRINDIELGKFVERQLTIMNISIVQFAKLTSGMKPEQILQFTNSYFGYIGPIIRKYGFVQNYNGDGLVALYKSQRKALSASVELQLATSAYNLNVVSKSDFPLVEVGISVQTGAVLVAIVGENERMECTILSSHHKTSAKLDYLIQKLNLRMLTNTLGTEVSIKKSLSSQIAYRMLGSMEVETSSGTQLTTVYEILKSSDNAKLQFRDDLRNAVTLFQTGRYAEAEPIFVSIVSELSDDTVSKLYLSRCERLVNQVKLISLNLGVQEVLKDDELFHGFEVFCQQEFSAENIVLWSEIEQYKVQPENKRRTIAKRLRREYLSLSGRKTININETLKEAVANEILKESHEKAPAAELFSDIQHELELLMTDTCNRYKASSLFFESLARSKYAIKAPYLDQL